MPDPFEALRVPLTPIDPDPTFAAGLKARLVRALGGDMDTPPIVPYLAVADARRALDWYVEVLGARRGGEPIIMPDERIGHAELELSGGLLYLADEFPEINVVAPRGEAGSGVSLVLQVGDVDAVAERAVRAGATLERPPKDEEYGRGATILDPFGHRWLLSGAIVGAATAQRPRPGDVAYVSLWVSDVERAAAFFGDVLGWTFAPASEPQGRQVEGTSLRHGLFGGQAHATLFCCYVVDDLDAAVARVRSAGGQAETPEDRPYGRLAECSDPDGMRFALLATGAPANPSPPSAPRSGDISYLTLLVRDSAVARDFYGSVLGWRFTPGRVEDGWNVEDTVPMSGLWGGADRTAIVPMYSVDDIHAAVERVRALGGTATDVVSESYGLMSECVDDQGTRFYLGQLPN